MSRVVPAIGEVIAASRRAIRFSRLDLPALGGPTIATLMPSRSLSPRWPSARCRLDFGGELARLNADAVFDFRRQIFVGEIDRGFEMGEDMGQAARPVAIKAAERAVELAQCLAALRLGLGRGEIGDRLGLSKVELAVQKRAAGELAGLSEPQPEPAQYLDERSEHGAAAVQVELGDILAGGAVRRREPQHQSVV